MDKDNIEKIVSETISNPDVMSFIVKQIQDQIEKEQKKVENNKITDKINKIKSKADTYLSDNNYLKDYVDNRNKYMDVFNNISNNISNVSKYEFKKEDSTDKTNSILDKLGIPHDEDGSVTIPINKEISNKLTNCDISCESIIGKEIFNKFL